MSSFCRQHPLESARWIDPEEHLHYCQRCVTQDGAPPGRALTRVGARELLPLRAQDGAPFWTQFGLALQFPFSPVPLLLWTMLVAVFAVAAHLAHGNGWVVLAAGALAAGLAGGVLLSRTGFSHRALVDRLAIVFRREVIDWIVMPAGLWGLIGVSAVLVPSSWWGIPTALLLAVWPAVAMQPAIIASGGEGGIKGLRHIVTTVGWPYGMLVMLAWLSSMVCWVVASVFFNELPAAAFFGVMAAAVGYCALVMWRLSGAVLLQYPALLNRPSRATGARSSTDDWSTHADWLAREGDLFGLERLLWKTVRARSSNIAAQEMLARVLAQRHDGGDLHAFLDQYLAVLLKAGDDARIAPLVARHVRHPGQYKPGRPEVRVALARWLRGQKKPDEAAALLLNLHHDHPSFSGLADAYWLLVQVLVDDMGRPDLARPSAEYVIQKFPWFPERLKLQAMLSGPH